MIKYILLCEFIGYNISENAFYEVYFYFSLKSNEHKTTGSPNFKSGKPLVFWFKMADVCIPVVNFSPLTLDKDDVLFDADQKVQEVASQICEAFSNIGFVYLKNHGISSQEVF